MRGALWVTVLGAGARVLSLGGTVALTYFLDREAIGEIAGAAILAASANQFSSLGVPNFLSTRRKLTPSVLSHAVWLFLGLGLVALLGVALLGPVLAGPLKVPSLARYLPLFALSVGLSRIAQIPEVLLQREMRFRTAATRRAAGEIAYTAVAVSLAASGAGGMAIVAGSLTRSSVQLVLLSLALPPSRWLARRPLSRPDLRAVLAFGLPISVSIAVTVVAQEWDSLFISARFGAGVMGAYALAFSLADVPAVQVTEQAGDVLAPSLAKLDAADKKTAISQLLGVLALIVYPLAIGLATTAPSLAALFRPEWAALSPFVAVLALTALFRPLGWTLSVYFQVTERPRAIMWLMFLLVAVLFPAMAVLGELFGAEGACFGVVAAFAVHALASIALVARADAIPWRTLLRGPLAALLACVPLALAVWSARAALTAAGLGLGPLRFGLEIVAGVLGFALGARLFAASMASDVIARVRTALRGKPEKPGKPKNEELEAA